MNGTIDRLRGRADASSAGEVCTHDVVCCTASAALNEAARLMREQHVGCLVVIDEPERGRRVPVGMLTDRDIVTAVVALDADARTLRVGDVMSTDLAVAREGDPLLDVLQAMQRKRVRRMPVLGTGGALVGLLALDDVLGVVAGQMAAAAAALGASRGHERFAA